MVAYETTTLHKGTLIPTGILTDGRYRWVFFSKLGGFMLTDRLVGENRITVEVQTRLNREIGEFSSLLESFRGVNEQAIFEQATDEDLLQLTNYQTAEEENGYAM